MTTAILRRPFAHKPASPFGLGALLLLLLTLTGCGVNNIPTFEEQAKAAWAQVQKNAMRQPVDWAGSAAAYAALYADMLA